MKNPSASCAVLFIDRLANRLFTPESNPLYYLGAICIFFFLSAFISGIYLFIFYKVSIPYETVKYITEGQRFYGGIIRSIHRYSADGLIIAILLHLLWVFLKDKYHQWRRIIWISGVVLLAVYLIDGIIGYWLVWDERAKAVAIITSKILDYIPVFIEPPPMSFLNNETISQPLFFVMTFFHLIIPFLSLIILWIHLSRISRPVIIPAKFQFWGILLAILIFSLIYPASIGPPADVRKLPLDVPIDWFYMFPYPVFSKVPALVFYLIFLFVLLGIIMIPWLSRSERVEAAEVTTGDCTGCTYCYRDCPYEAISMQSTDNGQRLVAEVLPGLCAGCGICVGACTFNAINLPDRTEDQIKLEIRDVLSGREQLNTPLMLLIRCEHTVSLNDIMESEILSPEEIPNVKVISLPCAGMMQSSMLDHAFRCGADRILICGCQIGDCHFREGNKWLEARILGERPPFFHSLKEEPYNSKVRVCWFSALQNKELLREIQIFSA